MTKKEIQKEYQEFLATSSATPPVRLQQELFQRVNKDLNPSISRVFSKLSLIHLGTSLVTLSVCPQFGLSTFKTGLGLNHLFMQLGELGCEVACGSFFLGTTAVAATLLMRPEEIRTLRKHKYFELAALTLMSLGAFMMLNASLVLNLALAWSAGSILGGAFFFEASQLWVTKSARST